MNYIQLAEEIPGINIILYDVGIVDGSIVGELVRWKLQKHPKTVRLLRYNSHIYYVANIQALFNAFPCPTCECYFCQPINLERHSATCRTTFINEEKKQSVIICQLRTVSIFNEMIIYCFGL